MSKSYKDKNDYNKVKGNSRKSSHANMSGEAIKEDTQSNIKFISTLDKKNPKNRDMFANTDMIQFSDPLLNQDELQRKHSSVEYNPRKSDFSLAFSYEESRDRNKMGLPASIIFMVKSAFGLGVFTSCFGFAKVGFILGSITCILLCYITTYGMYSVGALANEIERENKKTGLRLYTFHDTAMACVKEGPWRQFIKIFVILSLVFVNIAIPVANTVMMATFMKDNFEINTTLTKGAIGLIYLIVIIAFPEPEKIKFIATPIFISYIIIFISVCLFLKKGH